MLGHGTIETAQFGSEQDLSIGKVLSYPLSFFQLPELDYVGFGHIHRHQVLQKEKPLILYAGSLERVDFGEENEDKGFIYLELERKKTRYEFISTKPRKFLTIHCNLTDASDPQAELEKEIISKKEAGAITRVKYRIQEEKFSLIDQEKIKTLLNESFALTIQPETVYKERTYRIAELDSSLSTSPMLALDKYLFDHTEEDKKILLDKAKGLIDKL